MIVVSDTSPLRALQAIDRVWVLQSLYGQVVVPPAVRDELAVDADELGPFPMESYAFLSVRVPTDRARVAEVMARLGRGEAEALVLGLELGADMLLMDDAGARGDARRFGLRTRGVLGVLVDAKQSGLVPLVRPLIAAMQERIQFRASQAVIEAVLRDAGELPA